MKRYIVPCCACLCILFLGLAMGSLPSVNSAPAPTPPVGAALQTVQSQYELLRVVTVSDTPLSATTKAWSTIKSKFIAVPKWANGVRIACYADGDSSAEGDPNGGSFSYKVMVCERNSSAKLAGTGTWAIGELALSHDPTLATDTALTYATTDPNSSKWGQLPVISTNHFGLVASGTTDDIGELRFDLRGSAGIYLEVTSHANMTNLYALVKWY